MFIIRSLKFYRIIVKQDKKIVRYFQQSNKTINKHNKVFRMKIYQRLNSRTVKLIWPELVIFSNRLMMYNKDLEPRTLIKINITKVKLVLNKSNKTNKVTYKRTNCWQAKKTSQNKHPNKTTLKINWISFIRHLMWNNMQRSTQNSNLFMNH